MSFFSEALLESVRDHTLTLRAWVVLPNHYHLLVLTDKLTLLRQALGRLHGKTSFLWNGEDSARGRKVWHSTSDRVMRSEAHFYATMNYIHHNAVKHGYTQKWQDWPWSSARDFLDSNPREDTEAMWKSYPLRDYGKGWDD